MGPFSSQFRTVLLLPSLWEQPLGSSKNRVSKEAPRIGAFKVAPAFARLPLMPMGLRRTTRGAGWGNPKGSPNSPRKWRILWPWFRRKKTKAFRAGGEDVEHLNVSWDELNPG